MIKSFAVIVAATAKTFGIGKCGKLPWNKLPEDMAYFKNVTNSVQDPSKQNAVIMGRKTWLSIPEKFRPLEGRLNIILSRATTFSSNDLPSSTLLARSLEEALSLLSEAELASKVENVFVIGGSGVYSEALVHPSCSKIFLTEVYGDKYEDCDTFLPPIPDCFKEASCTDVRQDKKEGASYAFKVLVRENGSNGLVGHDNDTDQPNMKKLKTDPESKIGENQDTYITNDEEMQYLRCVQDIIENGALRGDRTGTGTLSKFGVQMRFSLRDNTLPLLTTKRVFWRGVAEELLWFVAGCTDARKLQEKDIHIWDGNGSKEYLDSLGFTNREEGDLGPVYGFQWRHWGAEYTNRDADYSGKGIDQLAECIEKIKNSPEDRRIILTAWNPSDLKQMALPPCHMFCQFYVANGELSCQMYQRSADMGLGVPFNIASYSLLTRIVAQVCNLQPGEFIHTIGDAHVYVNHVDALKEQLTRRPRPFPKLLINPLKTDIDSFEFSDFTVEGYNPDKTIKMKMAV